MLANITVTYQLSMDNLNPGSKSQLFEIERNIFIFLFLFFSVNMAVFGIVEHERNAAKYYIDLMLKVKREVLMQQTCSEASFNKNDFLCGEFRLHSYYKLTIMNTFQHLLFSQCVS